MNNRGLGERVADLKLGQLSPELIYRAAVTVTEGQAPMPDPAVPSAAAGAGECAA
jgi:hypothetical protein